MFSSPNIFTYKIKVNECYQKMNIAAQNMANDMINRNTYLADTLLYELFVIAKNEYDKAVAEFKEMDIQ